MLCEKCKVYSTDNKHSMSVHRNQCTGIESLKWHCSICDVYFGTRRDQQEHNKRLLHKKVDFVNKDNLKVSEKCPWCRRKIESTKSGFGLHKKSCLANPNRVPGSRHGVPRTEEEKLHLSEVMKERHRQNKAAKWVNPSIRESYAEHFFQEVIENEFLDKAVIRELPFKKYFFDFAWPHKMKVIEIDGQQHERYDHQIQSDIKKDALAKECGWHVMRIRWRDMYCNPKLWIQKAKDFVDFE